MTSFLTTHDTHGAIDDDRLSIDPTAESGTFPGITVGREWPCPASRFTVMVGRSDGYPASSPSRARVAGSVPETVDTVAIEHPIHASRTGGTRS